MVVKKLPLVLLVLKVKLDSMVLIISIMNGEMYLLVGMLLILKLVSIT